MIMQGVSPVAALISSSVGKRFSLNCAQVQPPITCTQCGGGVRRACSRTRRRASASEGTPSEIDRVARRSPVARQMIARDQSAPSARHCHVPPLLSIGLSGIGIAEKTIHRRRGDLAKYRRLTSTYEPFRPECEQMRTMNRFVAFILVFAATLPRAVYGLDLQPRFDPLARRLLDDRVAVGFVVGIVKDGQTAVSAYGETKKSSGITPTGDTVYEIGSITKVFTGILLADTMQRGIVKLDAPVQDYLPASVKLSVIDGQPITLQHLVTHTSGLPRLPENLSPVNRFNPYADYTVKRMYEFLRWYG